MLSLKLICFVLVTTPLVSLQLPFIAQSEKEVQLSHIGTRRSSCAYPLVLIDVETVDGSGVVVGDLTHRDFVISEKDIRHDVVFWEWGDAPLSLLILVDAAGTPDSIEHVRNQLHSLMSSLDYLEPRDEVKIVVLGRRPVVKQDYTGDAELIRQAVGEALQHARVTRSLDTPIGDRFALALQDAANHPRVHDPRARKAIILISGTSKTTADNVLLPENVLRAVLRSGSAFFWIGTETIAANETTIDEIHLDRISLTRLVALTGGEITGSDWDRFIERLRERHRIGFYVQSATEPDGKLVDIKFELAPNAGRDLAGLVVNYPRAVVIPPSR